MPGFNSKFRATARADFTLRAPCRRAITMFVSRRYLPLTGIDGFATRLNRAGHFLRRRVIKDASERQQGHTRFTKRFGRRKPVDIFKEVALLIRRQRCNAANNFSLDAHSDLSVFPIPLQPIRSGWPALRLHPLIERQSSPLPQPNSKSPSPLPPPHPSTGNRAQRSDRSASRGSSPTDSKSSHADRAPKRDSPQP